ncbi:MAG: magnesium protoporphyrin IX methyltransferase [Hyphomicrobiaceae bacterium]
MPTATYSQRRGEIETYFDRTAAETWKRLTSDAPVSGIRATVRAGRDRMRVTLLDWLPADLDGMRLLDAGCGTGALAIAAAARGADVVAIDIAPTLIAIAKERAEASPAPARGRVDFLTGDMLSPSLGSFDAVVGMDSLIHYTAPDMLSMVSRLAERCTGRVLFTFAPRTPALAVMHAVGRYFPRSDRAPAIEPVDQNELRSLIVREPALSHWSIGRTERIVSGFYTSQALELIRK